jgi:NADH-quinone oxidoreductase subunit L
MFDIPTLLILIPGLPLASALATAILGKRWLRQRSHIPAVTAIALAFAASLLLLFQVQRAVEQTPAGALAPVGVERVVTLWRWASIDDAAGPLSHRAASGTRERGPRNLTIDVTLRADPLTAIMLAMVTFISLLVAVYSNGYMHGDPGRWRFFTYINLFVFSMTMLVSVSNFAMLYVFWEAVGLCSYLLIGFWFEKPAAAAAGMKAFLVTRVGDVGFALGVFLLWVTYGTLDFHDTAQSLGILGQARLHSPELYAGGGLATAICLLLMLGACGKSAQFPLHVWLPDAMEGPTPVSALIHAATMVTAGVYMVTRCMPLFIASPDALLVVACIGGITALMAGFIAVTQNDLKRVLAYSTVSQLGYMFMALGAGTLLGVTAGMFHLFTHAFFKALLFLAAGSVMHAMAGVIDMRYFGGLRHRMPKTHWTFLFGCLALAGVVPFAGFWSKDLILIALREHGGSGWAGMIYPALYALGVGTAGLTAFYTFRAYFLTFWGPEVIPPEAGHHAHESPASMTVPLMILAVCALVVGAYFEFTHGFADFLQHTPSLAISRLAEAPAEHSVHTEVMLTSTVVAIVGILLAALVYLGSRAKADRLAQVADWFALYRLSYGKLFIDPAYRLLIVLPLAGLAWLLALADRYVIDGLVDFVGRIPRWVASRLRPLQGGLIPFYALAMILGLLVLIGMMFV